MDCGSYLYLVIVCGETSLLAAFVCSSEMPTEIKSDLKKTDMTVSFKLVKNCF